MTLFALRNISKMMSLHILLSRANQPPSKHWEMCPRHTQLMASSALLLRRYVGNDRRSWGDFRTEASEGWHTGNPGTATCATDTCGFLPWDNYKSHVHIFIHNLQYHHRNSSHLTASDSITQENRAFQSLAMQGNDCRALGLESANLPDRWEWHVNLHKYLNFLICLTKVLDYSSNFLSKKWKLRNIKSENIIGMLFWIY